MDRITDAELETALQARRLTNKAFPASMSGMMIERALVELQERRRAEIARPIKEYHEDDGNVLWWFFPISEPPYAGTPTDSSWDEHELGRLYTHWTPIPIPVTP